MATKLYGAAASLLLLAGCRSPGREVARSPHADSAASTARERPTILFLGTSLTAGLGVDQDSAYPAIIQRTIDSLRLGYHVVNAGVSGETSAGALRRTPWLLQHPPRVLVLETGANDGLRGLDADSTRRNIDSIVGLVHQRDSSIVLVLVGMEAPPNMGRTFSSRFHAVYPDLARRHHLPLVPFLLQDVGGIDTLNQADGIHPTPAGHRIVAATVWRVLGPILRQRAAA
jgi:acyl-CoA thioesterase-1